MKKPVFFDVVCPFCGEEVSIELKRKMSEYPCLCDRSKDFFPKIKRKHLMGERVFLIGLSFKGAEVMKFYYTPYKDEFSLIGHHNTNVKEWVTSEFLKENLRQMKSISPL